MDQADPWTTIRRAAAGTAQAPPAPVELWRLPLPGGRSLVCRATVVEGVGIEIRIELDRKLYQAIVFETLDEAREKSAQWRGAMLARAASA
jgi:hypothetical protein